ncbi:MAG: (d)CMP kinase [Planctomycetes bacterium]|nr:(d)CMP kinase [Planctomycetota bacterium]
MSEDTLSYFPSMDAQTQTNTLIVTIDGPAGAGKSTVARTLAARLGVDFLDTGAMYRGIAAAVIDHDLDPADVDKVGELAETLNLRFDWKADPPALKVDGFDLAHRLRDPDVTAAVSEIASNPRVRSVLVRSQRMIGHTHPRLVTEGRDQGSVVFPDATAKFYLDASAEVRAKRRADQLRAAGRVADEHKIREQIVYRDQRDSTRHDGPLICPADADRIDTSDMNLDEVVDLLVEKVRARVG